MITGGLFGRILVEVSIVEVSIVEVSIVEVSSK